MDESFKKAIELDTAALALQRIQDTRDQSLVNLAEKYGNSPLADAAGSASRSLEEMLRTHTVNQIYELKEGLETSLGRHSETAMLTDSARYRAALTSAATALETLGNQYYSFDLAASLAITHRDYAQALSLHSSQSAIEIACSQLNSHWAGQVGAFGYAYGSERATELALEAHYLSVSSTALLAQEYSSRLALENIGAATALPLADFEDIATQFSGLVDVYGQLLRSYQNEPCFIASLPPVASDGPPSERLENAILMDTLSTESPSQDIEESIGIHRQQHVWDEPTTDVLRALKPAFESAYIGALQALHSSNVDRARHVIVSLRELVTHILQHLVPDALVMVWSQDANHITTVGLQELPGSTIFAGRLMVEHSRTSLKQMSDPRLRA